MYLSVPVLTGIPYVSLQEGTLPRGAFFFETEGHRHLLDQLIATMYAVIEG
jgi:hypothetical protein